MNNTSSLQTEKSEKITGTIERTVFFSDDSGFCVLRIKARGHSGLVTVVGTLPEPRPGQFIEAHGQWVIDRNYGQQFRAEIIEASAPETRQGLVRYLSSGLIKGIGPVFAERLVDVFGRQVLDVMTEKPWRLLEVEGVGRSRQQAIVTAWQQQRSVHQIMVFLHTHGVSASRAFRIYKKYGQNAIDRISENPYQLANDIRGIGFRSADKIAGSLGIERSSPLRAQAAVEYVLGEFASNGHCGCDRGELTASVEKTIEIPSAVVQGAIDWLIDQQRLVAEYAEGEYDLLFLASLDHCEKQLAACLGRLIAGMHPAPGIDVGKAVQWVRERTGLDLADQQRQAVQLACCFKTIVITGGPGVGKTTTVNAIVKIMQARKLQVVLAAPTGRAAKRMTETSGLSAKTIHRLLAFDPATGGFRHNAGNPLKGDVFIIDETSMIDVVLGYHLVRAIPQHASLVLVGDIDQLPSIGPGCVLRDIIDSGTVPVCRLTQIFRQAAASMIVTNAHLINRGTVPSLPVEENGLLPDGDFHFIEADEPEKIATLVVQTACGTLPQGFGFDSFEAVQVLSPMQRGPVGCLNLNRILQEALNPQGPSVQRYGWTYRLGDKVMQTVNNYDKDIYNGDIGRITLVDEGDQELKVCLAGRSVTYDFNELDELIPAYATTIHKAQGSEYPAVVVPIHTQHYPLLQRNLLYTAITRAKKMCVVIGSKKALEIAVRRMESRRRVTLLKKRLMEL